MRTKKVRTDRGRERYRRGRGRKKEGSDKKCHKRAECELNARLTIPSVPLQKAKDCFLLRKIEWFPHLCAFILYNNQGEKELTVGFYLGQGVCKSGSLIIQFTRMRQ